jgi:hypothetical protein
VRRWPAALVAATICFVSQPAVSAAPAKATLLFRLADSRLQEVSGVAAGIASPNVFYVQNDSGDSARFFALDRTSGDVLTEYDVPGATNVDWEDIAVATDSRGVPSVWLADIGDNDSHRSSVVVYRVDEPHVRDTRGAVRTTSKPDVWFLTYPGGSRDAESLAVAPHGRAYIVSKSLVGASIVYRLPARPDARRTHELQTVGPIQFRVVKRGDVSSYPAQIAATGAAISPGGSTLVIRTYNDAYVWSMHDGDVAHAITGRATRIVLPKQPLGEGITVARDQLVISSEELDSPVYAVPRPGAKAITPSTRPSTHPSTATSPTHAASSAESDAGSGTLWWRVLGVFVLVVGALVGIAVVRGRRMYH